VDVNALAYRLATGLARVAVAVRADGPPDGLERTIAQQQVLLMLTRRHQVYPLSVLATELGMPEDATLAAVSTLVREGLVAMDPAPSYSPHQVRVALTEAGRAQAPELLNWAADLLAELEQMSFEHQRRLLALVTQQIFVMQRQDRIPVARMCVTCRYFQPYAYPGTTSPHHCWLVDAPFGYQDLRVRCPEASPAEDAKPAEAA
jgi:DNA-binding MarR family transcriptional regulator